MDNSGHLTGKGYGKKGHDDKHPLDAKQIDSLASIIKSAKKGDILQGPKIRGLQRFTIVRESQGKRLVVVEIVRGSNSVVLVSAYNLSKREFEKYKKLIKKQNSR